MAAPVVRRLSHQLVRAYHKWVYPEGHVHYRAAWRRRWRRLRHRERARYREAVRTLKTEIKYEQCVVEFHRVMMNDGRLYEPERQRCEHCMTVAMCMLTKLNGYGLVSGDQPGDWVCEACDPRVTGGMLLAGLETVLPGQ